MTWNALLLLAIIVITTQCSSLKNFEHAVIALNKATVVSEVASLQFLQVGDKCRDKMRKCTSSRDSDTGIEKPKSLRMPRVLIVLCY